MTNLSERLAELSGRADAALAEALALCTTATAQDAIDEARIKVAVTAEILAHELVNAYRAGRLIAKDEAHD